MGEKEKEESNTENKSLQIGNTIQNKSKIQALNRKNNWKLKENKKSSFRKMGDLGEYPVEGEGFETNR